MTTLTDCWSRTAKKPNLIDPCRPLREKFSGNLHKMPAAQCALSYPYANPLNGSYPDPAVYLERAIVVSVAASVSFIGVIMNLAFIYQKKTNFMVRRFIYFTIATTLQLGAYWLLSIIAVKDGLEFSTHDARLLIPFYFYLIPFTLWAISIVVFTISFSILTSVCCNTFWSRRNPWGNRSRSQLVRLEVLFVTLLFGPSFLGAFFAGSAVTFAEDIVIAVTLFSSVYLLPVVPVLLSLIIALLVRFYQLQRRQNRRSTILLKEIGVFFLLLIGTVLIWVFCFLSAYCSTSILIATSLLSVLIALFPLCLFVYMCRSLRTTTVHVRFANIENRSNHNNIPTAGLQTTPASTRVSLPTDTAEHAPNFLSPSTAEPSEVTPLIN